jgi:large subunit ribosomal protein L22
MNAKAVARFVRMSPRKARLVVDQIRGRPVNEAYALLKFSKKAAALPIEKTLRSAVANAQVKGQAKGEAVDADDLIVSEIFVDGGPTLRRFHAGAMGRAAPIRRKLSHVTVVVDVRKG